MSDASLIETRDADLVHEVLAALRRDDGLTALLGDPARIYEDETERPIFPYLHLERHERTDTSVSGMICAEHNLHFVAWTREGGKPETKKILSTLRMALQRMDLTLIQQRVTLIHPTYSDVLRTRNPRIMRGLLRVRIHTEEF